MKHQNKHAKPLFVSAIAVLLVVPVLVGVVYSLNARGISEICEKSEECKAAVEKEEEANRKNEEALSSAAVYQQKVEELSGQIRTEEATIERTKGEIEDLKEQIEINQQKLSDRQKGLADLIVEMHFTDASEPIKILAGSNSISDLAEKASREEIAKKEISAAAASVKETKETLERNKKAMDEKLQEQKQARANLIAVRGEQQEFVEKYQNDADAYAAVAEEARAEQQAAIAAYQKQHREVYMGSYYGAYNSYPYQDSCPQMQDAFIDDRGYYGCECTSYAAWKAYEYVVVNQGAMEQQDFNNWFRAWGNAAYWNGTAWAKGLTVDNNPTPNSVGQSVDGPYGHVFWVESVDDDGINITEYNNYYSTGIYNGGSYHSGDFGARHISFAEAYGYNYIHFD